MIDVDTQEPLAFAITFEKPGDSSMMVPFLQASRISELKLSAILADSAYDSIANWKSAAEMNIRFVLNLRPRFGKNSDLPERNIQFLAEQELGKTEFHLATGYNRRWLVEAFFSFEKKRFGEWMRSRRFDRMVLTMQRRRILCSMYKRLYARARGYTSRNRQMASEGGDSLTSFKNCHTQSFAPIISFIPHVHGQGFHRGTDSCRPKTR
ncbi:MAG: transposase [archaeon]|nr:transposase [archaeon]